MSENPIDAIDMADGADDLGVLLPVVVAGGGDSLYRRMALASKKRAGFTRNKGQGTPKGKRKMAKASRRMNRK